jgi:hypothetical protein
VAAAVAYPTCGHDIGSHFLAAITFGNQVLGRRTVMAGLSQGESPALGEPLQISFPHGMVAIMAEAILARKNGSAKVGKFAHTGTFR